MTEQHLQAAPLRVAVLGVGAMGAYHVEGLMRRTRGAQVTVINDFSLARAEKVSAEAPGSRVVTDPFDAIRAYDVACAVDAVWAHFGE